MIRPPVSAFIIALALVEADVLAVPILPDILGASPLPVRRAQDLILVGLAGSERSRRR